MGERTDDLAPQNDAYRTDYDQSKKIADRDVADENTGYQEEAQEADESVAEIRDNIADTRDRMGSTIDAIQEKLSPQNLMEQAKETARDATIGRAQEMANNVADTARETGSTLMDTIRENPVPVALTAIGLGWLVVSARREAANRRDEWDYGRRGYSRNVDRSRRRYPGLYDEYQESRQQRDSGGGQLRERMQDTAGKVSDQVQGAASNVGDRVQGAASNVADKAGDMADYAQWQAQRTRGWLERTWDDNPLLVAGAAAALGTIVGLSIPETPVENQLMGDARDNLVQKAQGVAQDTIQKAQSAATDATNQMANSPQTKTSKGSGTTH